MRPCPALSRSYNHQPRHRPRPLPHRQNSKHPSRTIRMGSSSNSTAQRLPQPLWPEPPQFTLRPYQRFQPLCTPLPRILTIRAMKAKVCKSEGPPLSQSSARPLTAARAAAATRARSQPPSTRQSAPQAEEALSSRLHRRCKHHCARNSSDCSVAKASTHPLRRHSRIRYLTRSSLL